MGWKVKRLQLVSILCFSTHGQMAETDTIDSLLKSFRLSHMFELTVLPAHHQHFVEQTSSLNLLWLIQNLLEILDLLDTDPQDMIAGCSHIDLSWLIPHVTKLWWLVIQSQKWNLEMLVYNYVVMDINKILHEKLQTDVASNCHHLMWIAVVFSRHWGVFTNNWFS